ncbi:hypothetical protein CFIMG_008340RA00001 [Ceratocystis fimbriata CBS 114723]|uniref:Uncharacterized protein n=1 Tax=Ceratocystis fimbriata CBS 114723 TaxID=1035309 RepID=A0A2C5WVN4_9PEZI|nr:hypothetical protein CFIMG_008340RA00001 [Ceratocystis fimbriata CBS 114723]
MPPHLHPRSRTTSSLFAATIAASFLVVGLPHVLPCPRTVTYADSNTSTPSSSPLTEFFYVDEQGRRHRRRRRDLSAAGATTSIVGSDTKAGLKSAPSLDLESPKSTRQMHNGMVQFLPTDGDATPVEKVRECPVPKPGGFIGGILGLKSTSSRTEAGQGELGSRSDI